MDKKNTFSLKRTKQCKKCPFKKGTNPREIPNGYCELKHQKLENTIAIDGEIDFNKPSMACHHSKKEPDYCVGWLHNQLGKGNNIPLRLKMLNCDNIKDIEVVGEQHLNFRDTLPKKILKNE